MLITLCVERALARKFRDHPEPPIGSDASKHGAAITPDSYPLDRERPLAIELRIGRADAVVVGSL